MTNSTIIIVAVILLLILILIFLRYRMNRVSVFNLEIGKSENGIWRVFDRDGNNRGTLVVSPGDSINWSSADLDLDFRFDIDVRKYFQFDQGLFSDNKTQSVDGGEKLSVTVRRGAPHDNLVYNIYVESADEFVVGNSPPVIIFKERK